MHGSKTVGSLSKHSVSVTKIVCAVGLGFTAFFLSCVVPRTIAKRHFEPQWTPTLQTSAPQQKLKSTKPATLSAVQNLSPATKEVALQAAFLGAASKGWIGREIDRIHSCQPEFTRNLLTTGVSLEQRFDSVDELLQSECGQFRGLENIQPNEFPLERMEKILTKAEIAQSLVHQTQILCFHHPEPISWAAICDYLSENSRMKKGS